MPVERLILLSFLFNLVKSLLVIDLFEEEKLLSVISCTVGVILHDILDSVWLRKGVLMLSILQIETL